MSTKPSTTSSAAATSSSTKKTNDTNIATKAEPTPEERARTRRRVSKYLNSTGINESFIADRESDVSESDVSEMQSEDDDDDDEEASSGQSSEVESVHTFDEYELNTPPSNASSGNPSPRGQTKKAVQPTTAAAPSTVPVNTAGRPPVAPATNTTTKFFPGSENPGIGGLDTSTKNENVKSTPVSAPPEKQATTPTATAPITVPTTANTTTTATPNSSNSSGDKKPNSNSNSKEVASAPTIPSSSNGGKVIDSSSKDAATKPAATSNVNDVAPKSATTSKVNDTSSTPTVTIASPASTSIPTKVSTSPPPSAAFKLFGDDSFGISNTVDDIDDEEDEVLPARPVLLRNATDNGKDYKSPPSHNSSASTIFANMDHNSSGVFNISSADDNDGDDEDTILNAPPVAVRSASDNAKEAVPKLPLATSSVASKSNEPKKDNDKSSKVASEKSTKEDSKGKKTSNKEKKSKPKGVRFAEKDDDGSDSDSSNEKKPENDSVKSSSAPTRSIGSRGVTVTRLGIDTMSDDEEEEKQKAAAAAAEAAAKATSPTAAKVPEKRKSILNLYGLLPTDMGMNLLPGESGKSNPPVIPPPKTPPPPKKTAAGLENALSDDESDGTDGSYSNRKKSKKKMEEDDEDSSEGDASASSSASSSPEAPPAIPMIAVEEHERELAKWEQKVKTLTNAMQENKTQQTNEISLLQKKISDLDVDRQDKASALTKVQRQLEEMLKSNEGTDLKYRALLDSLMTEVAEKEKQLQAQVAHVQTLQKSLKDLQDTDEKKEQTLKSLQAQLLALQEEGKISKQQQEKLLVEKTNEMKQLTLSLDALQGERNQQVKSMQSLSEKVALLEEERQRREQEAFQQQQDLAKRTKQEQEQAGNDLKQLLQRIAALEQQQQEAPKLLQQREEVIDNLQRRLQDMEEEKADLKHAYKELAHQKTPEVPTVQVQEVIREVIPKEIQQQLQELQAKANQRHEDMDMLLNEIRELKQSLKGKEEENIELIGAMAELKDQMKNKQLIQSAVTNILLHKQRNVAMRRDSWQLPDGMDESEVDQAGPELLHAESRSNSIGQGSAFDAVASKQPFQSESIIAPSVSQQAAEESKQDSVTPAAMDDLLSSEDALLQAPVTLPRRRSVSTRRTLSSRQSSLEEKATTPVSHAGEGDDLYKHSQQVMEDLIHMPKLAQASDSQNGDHGSGHHNRKTFYRRISRTNSFEETMEQQHEGQQVASSSSAAPAAPAAPATPATNFIPLTTTMASVEVFDSPHQMTTLNDEQMNNDDDDNHSVHSALSSGVYSGHISERGTPLLVPRSRRRQALNNNGSPPQMQGLDAAAGLKLTISALDMHLADVAAIDATAVEDLDEEEMEEILDDKDILFDTISQLTSSVKKTLGSSASNQKLSAPSSSSLVLSKARIGGKSKINLLTSAMREEEMAIINDQNKDANIPPPPLVLPALTALPEFLAFEEDHHLSKLKEKAAVSNTDTSKALRERAMSRDEIDQEEMSKHVVSMWFFYQSLFELLGNGIRASVLRVFHVIELSITPTMLMSLTDSEHHHGNDSNNGTNNNSGPSRRRSSAAYLTPLTNPTANSSHHNSTSPGGNGNGITGLAQQARRRSSLSTTAAPSSSSPDKIAVHTLVPNLPFFDTISLLELISQRYTLDIPVKTQVHTMLTHCLHLHHIDDLLQPLHVLIDAYYHCMTQQEELRAPGQFWELNALFSAAKVLTFLFGTEDSNMQKRQTSGPNMHHHNPIGGNHHTLLDGHNETSLSTESHHAYLGLKELQEKLQHCLYYAHVQHQKGSQAMQKTPFSSASAHQKGMDSSFLTALAVPLDSTTTWSSLLSDCNAICAQLMVYLLPKNLSLLECLYRLGSMRDVLQSNVSYFKSIHRKDVYKSLRTFAQVIDKQLDLDLLSITNPSPLQVNQQSNVSFSERVQQCVQDLQVHASDVLATPQQPQAPQAPTGQPSAVALSLFQDDIARFMFEKCKQIVTKAEDLFQRMKAFRDHRMMSRKHGNHHTGSASADDDTSSDEEESDYLHLSQVNNNFNKSRKQIEFEEKQLMESSLQQLTALKEDLRKRMQVMINVVTIDEMDVFVKSQQYQVDALPARFFEVSLKRDDTSVAVLLIRSQSIILMHSIYSTWPNLTFSIPYQQTSTLGNATEATAGSSSAAATGRGGTPKRKNSIRPGLERAPSITSGASTMSSPPTNRRPSLSFSMSELKEDLLLSPNGSVSNANPESFKVCPSNEIDLSALNFGDTKSLRKAGFTLMQLRESKLYNWSQLLSAGYPLQEIKLLRNVQSAPSHSMMTNGNDFNSTNAIASSVSAGLADDVNFELTVLELRRAGYSIEQCVKAGFDANALRAGGFDELQLVQSGLFTAVQLKKAGCDVQRFALRALFEFTNGKYWRKKENWCTNKPLKDWFGVKVDGQNNVIKIDLRNNELEGTLPEALCLLTSLEYLDLFNNHISGEVPQSFCKLTALKDLWLDNNHITMRKAQLQAILPNCRVRL